MRRPACPRAAPLDRRKLQERQGCSSALALRGGGHTDDEAESDAESATFSDVVLLGFDESAVMWRQRGRGALHLLNLASGEPRLTFSATSTVPNGGTEAGVPNLSHALWEMLDFQPLTVEPSARSLAYELPAELMSSTAACPPKHDIMVGWRFATAEAAHLFEQALLKVQARLRCERHGGLVRERRSAGSDSPDMVSIMAGQQNRAKRWRPLHKSQGWVKTREHGLSAQHLHDMLHMNTETVVFHDEVSLWSFSRTPSELGFPFISSWAKGMNILKLTSHSPSPLCSHRQRKRKRRRRARAFRKGQRTPSPDQSTSMLGRITSWQIQTARVLTARSRGQAGGVQEGTSSLRAVGWERV